jgi:hypothetical protein
LYLSTLEGSLKKCDISSDGLRKILFRDGRIVAGVQGGVPWGTSPLRERGGQCHNLVKNIKKIWAAAGYL